MLENLRRRALFRLLPPPVRVRHAEYSMILSADDDRYPPDGPLLEFALESVRVAAGVDLRGLSDRLKEPPRYPDVWPGEHYRLLAAMVQVAQPKLVVEVGTATGLSALAMKGALPPGGKVITYDLVAWNEYPGSVLKSGDLDGSLEQRLVDLGDEAGARSQSEILRTADFIFVDAAKDGDLERRIAKHFDQIGLARRPWVVFDDIRVWNMLAIWRDLAHPKLDLTSFGHWSGTGLVAWR